MADNFLEKRMEDLQKRKVNRTLHKKRNYLNNFNELVKKNRSVRGYDSEYLVTRNQLEEIIKVNTLIPSAKNQQILRFKPINGELAREYVKNVKLGALLPELSLPMQGTEPNAFIIICTKSEINNWSYIDIGISAQTMLLKAVTMGLNGICIGAFNLEKTKQLLPEGYKP